MCYFKRCSLREDLLKVLQWYIRYNKGDISNVLRITNQHRTRNNGFKLEKFRFRREIGKKWFSNRIVMSGIQ